MGSVIVYYTFVLLPHACAVLGCARLISQIVSNHAGHAADTNNTVLLLDGVLLMLCVVNFINTCYDVLLINRCQ